MSKFLQTKPAVLAMSTGLLLVAQAAYSQNDQSVTLEQEAQDIELEQLDFDQVDENNDGQVDPEELNRALDPQLSEVGWDEQNVFGDYDANQDEALDEMEYYALTRAVSERQEFRAAELEGDAESADAPAAGEQVQAMVKVTPVEEVPVDELVDRELVKQDGDEIGTVEDVVRRQDGSEQGLVVKTGGGLFGLGSRSVVVNADEVRLTEEQLVWEPASDEANVDNLPEYSEDEYVSVQ